MDAVHAGDLGRLRVDADGDGKADPVNRWDAIFTTIGLLEWGKPGPGRWVTNYVNEGHTFLEFRFAPPKPRFWGTSGMRPSGYTGPGWIAEENFGSSYLATFEKRHPPGL